MGTWVPPCWFLCFWNTIPYYVYEKTLNHLPPPSYHQQPLPMYSFLAVTTSLRSSHYQLVASLWHLVTFPCFLCALLEHFGTFYLVLFGSVQIGNSGAVSNIRLKRILNSNPVKSRFPITYFAIAQSLKFFTHQNCRPWHYLPVKSGKTRTVFATDRTRYTFNVFSSLIEKRGTR